MKTTVEKIEEVCKQAFEEYGLDHSIFLEHIVCFNETGSKCSIVYTDTITNPKIFVIVCSYITLNKEWKLDLFEKRDNYNPVNAMRLANNYLRGNLG